MDILFSFASLFSFPSEVLYSQIKQDLFINAYCGFELTLVAKILMFIHRAKKINRDIYRILLLSNHSLAANLFSGKRLVMMEGLTDSHFAGYTNRRPETNSGINPLE